jgi:hypothetical protein
VAEGAAWLRQLDLSVGEPCRPVLRLCVRVESREATMFGISRTIKCGAAILAAAVMLVTFAPPSYADSGTVRFRITRAGFIVGAGGGTGTLVFHGRTYPLSVGGLSVGTIGAATGRRRRPGNEPAACVGHRRYVHGRRSRVLRLPAGPRRHACGTRTAFLWKCADARSVSRPPSI